MSRPRAKVGDRVQQRRGLARVLWDSGSEGLGMLRVLTPEEDHQ